MYANLYRSRSTTDGGLYYRYEWGTAVMRRRADAVRARTPNTSARVCVGTARIPPMGLLRILWHWWRGRQSYWSPAHNPGAGEG